MLTCVISDARPQYEHAQQVIATAPENTVMVLTYRHKWVAPSAQFTVGSPIRLSKPCPHLDDEYGKGVQTMRLGTLIGVDTSDVGLHLTVRLAHIPVFDLSRFVNYTPQYFLFPA